MCRVIIGGMKWVEKEIAVPDSFSCIIKKANGSLEPFSEKEQQEISNLRIKASQELGLECTYIGTIDGETILDMDY